MTERASGAQDFSAYPPIVDESPTYARVSVDAVEHGLGATADAPRGEEAMNEIPRRCRMDLLTPAERAIYDAVQAVEAMAADERLTDAVILLQAARDSVADYVDNFTTLRRFVTMSPQAALSSPSVADSPTWQPIATAPKDGTEVLVFHGGHVSVCWWEGWGDGWIVAALADQSIYAPDPTHWMPLPSAPSPSAAAQQETP